MTNKEETKKVTLFLIDVQNDFHPPNGSLAVPNADKDAKRIAQLIIESLKTSSFTIDRIVCSMDSHHTLHIAHRGFWIKGKDYLEKGEKIHPVPFTTISSRDIEEQIWIPRPDIRSDYLGMTGQRSSVIEYWYVLRVLAGYTKSRVWT